MSLVTPDFIRPRLTRPAAIFGGGASGRAVRELLGALGAEGTIFDEKAGESFGPAQAQAHSLAVFSPGFSPEHPWLAAARTAGCECLGELDFASLFWRGRVVAITGTNGKTTLTEFLTHALREAGETAVAAGNIGHPFSRLAAETGGGGPEAIAICEVSSFQAETLRHFRAEAVLWTNFAEDHLERHPGMKSYFLAKAALAARSGRIFAGSSVREPAQAWLARDPAALSGNWAGAVWVPTEGRPPDHGLDGTVFADYPQRENFLLAAAWWEASGRAIESLYAAARTFRLGRHRLAKVAEIDGVAYWNDSKATNFHAVEAALSRFSRPVLLIAGGKSKGGDIPGFVRRIAPRIGRAFLIGETQAALAWSCAAAGVPCQLCATLEEAVRAAAAAARPGDPVLLSPGFASFDMFRGYEDRGDRFERLVRELTPASLCG